MKQKFSTYDIQILAYELRQKLTGLRVINVYDIDSKTFLIKFNKPDEKCVLLIESGIRFHTTDFEWPKNMMPSGFAMKMRKHLKGRRLEEVNQLGVDRIVDMRFGSGEAAYHIIIELYDRGNIVLTDHEYIILNIQRPRTDNNQDVKFIVREKYPIELAKQSQGVPTEDFLKKILEEAKKGNTLKKILTPITAYGGHLIEHCLLEANFKANVKIGDDYSLEKDLEKLLLALNYAENIMTSSDHSNIKGFIIHQKENKGSFQTNEENQNNQLILYIEFHPLLFNQHKNESYSEFDSFDKAIDEYFSKIESQKQDKKILLQERDAMKKLNHIKADHQKRIDSLRIEQSNDVLRARLIELNLDLVDEAIKIVRSALASQLDWQEINRLLKEACGLADNVGYIAKAIKHLKLDTNHMTMLLKPPENLDLENEEVDDDGEKLLEDMQQSDKEFDKLLKPMNIDINLELSAYANARKFYDMKRQAATKENRTIDASTKAFKSAERKTKQTLKEVQTIATISKARKTHWFEKFLWFISSENYVVIGGRDQQQNEFIVKKYLKPGDLYVHADLHGASSVVIKNPSKEPVSPVTLNEAGAMALCNSVAWEAKVVTSSWWVYHDQVSKTAPSGEYLTTGSFMIRGKKNYLLPSYLIYGFGFLFKVDESCMDKHKNERRVRSKDELQDIMDDQKSEQTEDHSLSTDDDDDDDENNDKTCISDNEDNSSKRFQDSNTTPGLSSSFPDNKTKNINDTNIDASKFEVNKKIINEDFFINNNNESEVGKNKLKTNDASFKSDDIRKNKSSCKVHFAEGESILERKKPDAQINLTISDKFNRTNIKNEDKLVAEEKGEIEFPDTQIKLDYVVGNKFLFQKSLSTREDNKHEIDNNVLSDSIADNLIEKPLRLSAKQRREIKKQFQNKEQNIETKNIESNTEIENCKDDKDCNKESKQQSEPLKRGQKSKIKKIKEKYADQDDEERQIRMEILASNRGPKEPKKKKNSKSTKTSHLPMNKPAKQPNSKIKNQSQITENKLSDIPNGNSIVLNPGQTGIVEQKDKGILASVDNFEEIIINSSENGTLKDAKNNIDDTDDIDPEESDVYDVNQLQQEINLLDSLSGIPNDDDLLLYCIPVCAPYSALINYKYKVKLTPGSVKRGKAAKMALNMFMHEKITTTLEKDVFRSVKDTDLSRNMPGRVKISVAKTAMLKNKNKK